MTPFALKPRMPVDEDRPRLTPGAAAFVLGASLGLAGSLLFAGQVRRRSVAGAMAVPGRRCGPIPASTASSSSSPP
jgi:hypothetical protein